MAKFEITIYNKEVREKVEAGERHRLFPATWADFQYIEITDADEEEARARIEEMHPSVKGFVIDNSRTGGGGF